MPLIRLQPRRRKNNANVLTVEGGNSIDVFPLAIANGWDQVSPLTVNVTADVGSTSTTVPAINFNGTYPDVTLNIAAGIYVVGRGGLGAQAVAGQAGGPAIKIQGGQIKINNLGVIAGGGGAGGGYYTGTRPGGNGAGLPILAPPANTTAATKTNGGNGASGTRGSGGIGGVPGSPGSTNNGAGGGGGLGAAGGASSNYGSGFTYSDPGGEGQAGPGTTDSDATAWSHPSYPGGAAGNSVIGMSMVSWIAAGTIYGTSVP